MKEAGDNLLWNLIYYYVHWLAISSLIMEGDEGLKDKLCESPEKFRREMISVWVSWNVCIYLAIWQNRTKSNSVLSKSRTLLWRLNRRTLGSSKGDLVFDICGVCSLVSI